MHFPVASRASELDRITREIRELQARQGAAFERAVYLGMSPELARECDERRRRIFALTDQLIELCKSRT